LDKKQVKLLLIDWIDAVGGSPDWTPLTDLKKQTLPLIQSVGWLLSETPAHITLCPHMDRDMGFGEITIPKTQIKKRKVLKC